MIGLIIIVFIISSRSNAHPTTTTTSAVQDLSSIELSFKTLESGESSGEIVNQCCQREPKFVTVGYGMTEGQVRVDVGECRQKCVIPSPKPLKRDEFDRYLKKYPDMDPIQIFMTLQSKSPSSQNDDVVTRATYSRSSCLQSTCTPTTYTRHTYYDLHETKQLDIIDSCSCVSVPRGCERSESSVLLYSGTPYERTVDVGECLGSCDNDDDDSDHCVSCKPVRNRTVSVDGPNGATCISTVHECQCVGECFRSREIVEFYDYSHNNNSQPFIKTIDIGRCSGSCSDAPVASKCLLWSNALSSNGTCLSYLSGKRSCVPTKFVSHSYVDKSGNHHTVMSVTGCGCR